MVRIHCLPSPHTLLPPSDKLSILRGVHASSSSDASFVVGGGGENNLAFKCTRKKLVFETLHLDVEGGVGERRTKPSEISQAVVQDGPELTEGQGVEHVPERELVEAAVEIKMEAGGGVGGGVGGGGVEDEKTIAPEEPQPPKARLKTKKKVAFRSDRPELYDF